MLKLSKKKTKLLITGGSGFLGKSILNNIDKNKFSVTLISRKKIKGFKCLIVKDMFALSIKYYLKILKRDQIVLHLAWYAKPKYYLNSFENFHCLTGSVRFATACKIKKIKKFIGIGSCLEYANNKKRINPKDNTETNSIYTGTKISFYNYCKDLFVKSKTKFLWCRVFYLYGIGEPKEKLVSYTLSRISRNKFAYLSKGSQIKDFINVQEASDQIIKVINNDNYHGALNICSGKGVSVKEFIISFAKKIKKEKYLFFNKKKLNNVDPKYIIGIKSVI
jgi:dTDP-6-deoxy-L-talose 4-dehydrogenase (NAD+)